MKHLRPVNRKALRIESMSRRARRCGRSPESSRSQAAHTDGCSLVFFPGWEVDSAGGTAALPSRWSATSSTVTSLAFGPRTSRSFEQFARLDE